MNLAALKLPELLRKRCITRSSDNPTGDLAEYLFGKAFGWKQVGNSYANVNRRGIGLSSEVASLSVLKAYLDESGIHSGSKACIVAGYFGKTSPWRKLGIGWKATLRRFNVPLYEFHAKDAVNKAGFFLRWDWDRRDDFLEGLGNAVSECRIFPVCYGTFTQDFMALSMAERRFLTGATWHAEKRKFLSSGSPNKPYFVAFTECLKVVTSYVSD